MLNEQLLQQVREGEASIELETAIEAYREKVEAIAKGIKEIKITGMSRFFWFENSRWFQSNYPPTGLTPIPLDRFFEEEWQTIGSLIEEAINLHELSIAKVEQELNLPVGVLKQLMNDDYYPSNVPVVLFKNLLLSLHIPFDKVEGAMLPTFKLLQSKETPETIKAKSSNYQLWENEETVSKYTAKLKSLMVATPKKDDFFKEEELQEFTGEVIHHPPVDFERLVFGPPKEPLFPEQEQEELKAFLDVVYQPPTPEQPSLPEGKEVEGNSLIADFLGWKKIGDSEGYFDEKNNIRILCFDKHWGEMMPAVEKLSRLITVSHDTQETINHTIYMLSLHTGISVFTVSDLFQAVTKYLSDPRVIEHHQPLKSINNGK